MRSASQAKYSAIIHGMASQQEEPSGSGDGSSENAAVVPVNDDDAEEEGHDVYDIYEFDYKEAESDDGDTDAYAADEDIYDFQYDDGDDDGSASKQEQKLDHDDDEEAEAEKSRGDEKTEEGRLAEKDGGANPPLIAESKQEQASDGQSTIVTTPLRSAESKRGGRLDTKGLGKCSNARRGVKSYMLMFCRHATDFIHSTPNLDRLVTANHLC